MKWNHEQHSKKQFRLGSGDPFFTSGKWQIIELLAMFFFFQRPERGERLMNDCFPVAYVFSALRNRILHPTRTRIRTAHIFIWNIIVGKRIFYFLFHLSFIFSSSLRFAKTHFPCRILHIYFLLAGEKGFSDYKLHARKKPLL